MSSPAEDRQLIEYYRTNGFADDEELLSFIEAYFDLHVPQAQVCPDHIPPAEYVTDTFFGRVIDAICWANRGGGKTLLGALITFLDSTFLPHPCGTKILGGSKEQSQRMYDHLTGKGDGYGIVKPEFEYLIDGEMLASRTQFYSGSHIQILTATMRSVRGPHPQRLKLDEVDEVDPRIYESALSIPMSKGGIKASTHIFSTMHRPYGLMQQVVDEGASRGYKLYKWCILCVMERCEGRECNGCELWDDCQGRGKNADGFYPIEDIISKKRQVTDQTWKSEYLCLIPSQEGLIYKGFEYAVHVVTEPIEDGEPGATEP